MRTDDSEPGGKWKDVSREKWNDWRWQMQNCLTTLEELKEVIQLTPAEEEGIIGRVKKSERSAGESVAGEKCAGADAGKTGAETTSRKRHASAVY